jgi:hypothetical protein
MTENLAKQIDFYRLTLEKMSKGIRIDNISIFEAKYSRFSVKGKHSWYNLTIPIVAIEFL